MPYIADMKLTRLLLMYVSTAVTTHGAPGHENNDLQIALYSLDWSCCLAKMHMQQSEAETYLASIRGQHFCAGSSVENLGAGTEQLTSREQCRNKQISRSRAETAMMQLNILGQGR